MVTGVSVLTILPYAVYISMPAKAAFPDLDFFRPHSIHKVQFLECFWGFTEFDPRAACVLSDHSVPLDKQRQTQVVIKFLIPPPPFARLSNLSGNGSVPN